MKRLIILRSINLILLLWIFNNVLSGQQAFPGEHWQQYENVADAGFSADKLESVKIKFDSTAAASLLVVYNGKVLLSAGDNTRRFMTHSMRKSFLNALYGVYINNGNLNLNSTLEALNIDDVTPLTSTEKQATIRDLLSARSGIYLPAAYSPKGMAKNLPVRGSHEPGSFWYYNNWDFNVLSTIFEQQVGNKVFEDFYQKIAQPLGMEDFRLMDGHYRFEPDKSKHPAYLFKMSARDMARFGWLYLNEGKWNNQQLIPAEWVNESTSSITEDLGAFNNKGSYGYLWWVLKDFHGHKLYYASGAGGQRIFVLPEADIVVVHCVNTYEGKNVRDAEILLMLKDILAAKTSKAVAKPSTVPYNPKSKMPEHQLDLDPELLATYMGAYKHPFLGNFTIKKGKEGLELGTNVGDFKIFATDQNHFFPEDLETIMELKPAPSEEQKRTVEPVFGPDRSLQKAIFYF